MVHDAPLPTDTAKQDALLLIGVFENEQGRYEYGSRSDTKTDAVVGGTVLPAVVVEKLAERALALENTLKPLLPMLGASSADDAVSKLLTDKGYQTDNDFNVLKDGKVAPPAVLLSALESSVRGLQKATALLKKCGVGACDSGALYTHLDSARVANGVDAPPVPEEAMPLSKPFDLAQMQNTLGAFEFFKQPANIKALTEIMSRPNHTPETWSESALVQSISVSNLGKNLAAQVGNSFLQGYLVRVISDAYRQNPDPEAAAQHMMSELEGATLSFSKTWRSRTKESATVVCGVDYDVRGEILPTATQNGLTAGCAVRGRF